MMMIYDVKDGPILKDYSQELSMSSKYDLEDEGVLKTFLILLESLNLAHKSRITYNDDPWYQGWPYICYLYLVRYLLIVNQEYMSLMVPGQVLWG